MYFEGFVGLVFNVFFSTFDGYVGRERREIHVDTEGPGENTNTYD